MRVISLFSGAGGLDLGLIRSGHEIVWANDNDEDAATTYAMNVGWEIELADIEKVNLRKIPDADVVVGGFPCQGFSQANLLRHGNDDRNKLFRFFVATLMAKRPSFFVAENVRGLLSLEGGRAKDIILKAFRAAGYSVEYRVLNAADYGVPQRRMRVIFLGTRLDLIEKSSLTFPPPTHADPRRAVALGLRPWIGIGEVLRGIPDIGDETDLPNHVSSQYKVAYRNFTGHRRTDPSKPSPTILARGNAGGGVCAIPHPFRDRRLSVRESAIVQTFPNDFEFFGALNSMYRQIGNAVPVRLGEAIGAALRSAEVGQ